MKGVERCPEGGVPRQFADNHVWAGGGFIVQSSDTSHRMALIESDNLDVLFKGIEDILGLPIERIVIETKRRATRQYIDRLVPDEIKEKAINKELDMQILIDANNAVARIMGYGDVSPVGYRYERDDDDYLRQRVREPYSVPLWCGDMTGAVEAITRRDNDVKYEFLAEDTIEILCIPCEHPPQFQGRLRLREYHLHEGDVELERCAGCGGPAALSAFRWYPERGVIRDEVTGRRVAMLGPSYLEAVFDELERELGEEIPLVVVEAQRRFVKSGFFGASEIESEEQFRKLLALRGLGNLRSLQVGRNKLRMVMENTAMYLMLVGLMQGYFETVVGGESRAEWEFSEEGELTLEIHAVA
ncbi:MAG: hypothetical protein H5T73_05530 [Actinobacteria bacterium]|nr:hypothetical protein [Actinomycetota bacterium]